MIPSSHVTARRQLPLTAELENPIVNRTQAAAHDSNPVSGPGPLDGDAQAKGDSELAGLVAHALRLGARTGRVGDINHIPPASAFGQWWSHLHAVMNNPHFVRWAAGQKIDRSKAIEINPRENYITAMVDGQRKTFSGFDHGYVWTSMMAPIMRAVKAATSDSGYIYSASNTTWAPYWAIADFYGEPIIGQTRESAEARATELEHAKAFGPTSLAPERSEGVLQEEKAKMANSHDQTNVASALIDIVLAVDDLSAELLYRTTKDPLDSLYLSPSFVEDKIEQLIRNKMGSVSLSLHADSPFQPSQESPTVSLHTYISDNGWDVPKHRDELFNLGRSLTTPPLSQPPHGNFGGALSWPVPLNDDDRYNVRNALRRNTLGLSELQHYDEDKGVLGYLTHNQSFAPYQLHDPARFIQTLLATPKAQALGKALQEKFDGISTSQSNNDWTLGALGATLDKESEAGNTSAPARTGIAGFDMARYEHWGQHPSVVVAGLVSHLVAKGRASAELAPIAAHVLLSRRAPAFLVKDIPEKITYGSHSWVSLSTAVARLESQAPGATAHMNYAEVMQRAALAPVTEQARQVEQSAQRDALKDWGVAHGIIPLDTLDDYTDEQMRRVFSAFNTQVSALHEASQVQSTPMPERPKIALKALQEVFGNLPFEKKCITPFVENRDFPGPYSVLDLYLKGELRGTEWTSSSADIDVRRIAANAGKLPDVNEIFHTELYRYFSSAQQSTATHVKHLIAALPLEDRKKLEYGKITLLKEYLLPSVHYRNRYSENWKVPGSLLVKAQLGGNVDIYEVNTKQNSVRKRNELIGHPTGRGVLMDIYVHKMLLEVKPTGNYPSNIAGEKPLRGTPDSFASEKTRYIADALVQDLGIRALEDEARGITTFDTEVPFYKKAREFMLDLIPLRSAIQNFRAGNIGDGMVDLAFDAFGFAVGIGTAAKGGKALQAGASTLNRFSRGAKIVGRGALGSLNPVDGWMDLARGGTRLIKQGTRHAMSAGASAVNALKGAGHYDVLKAASKHYDAVATGTYKRAEETLEGAAVLRHGKWYRYDPASSQAFGTALSDFLPSMGGTSPAFGDWAVGQRVLTDSEKAIKARWDASVKRSKFGVGKFEFEAAYYSTNPPKDLMNKTKNMTAMELMALAQGNTTQAGVMGTLVRQYDNLAFKQGKKTATQFIDTIDPDFGTVFPIPQTVYLSSTAQFSDGQCAALSRALATAVEQGKEKTLINNLFKAAARPDTAEAREFMRTLSRLQTFTGGESTFHAQKVLRQVTPQDMVRELSRSTVTQSVMIDSPGHAMAAGVVVDGADKKYYFYDPNAGVAFFPSAEAMETGLTKLFNDKRLQGQYRTHGVDPKRLEFKIFDHDDGWRKLASIDEVSFTKLFDVPLHENAVASISHERLKERWDTLQKVPGNEGLNCYQASLRVAQAEHNLTPEAVDAVKAATKGGGATSYTPRYLELMGITPDDLKTTFNAADIKESGFLNFKHGNDGGEFGHTVYIQKTDNNELFLFNTNSPDLDVAMIKNGKPIEISGGMTVFHLDDAGQRGLQGFLDGIAVGKDWQFVYTPVSTVTANVQGLPH
ncbi:hypothetical protein H8S66_01485 [Pseudomonas lurida]|uniref:hypothetical protein n=1 Tax=Pseudomonas lurida TaxID=244566 RepID=UPI0016541681|nr:hypothetical protein [Pseudomonas lurida]MBC3921524.1 hypothetical protein [Pseudomonas lurida]